MVARITWGYSLKRTLQYNEQKVAKGIADCLEAVNYLQQAETMSFSEKLHRLTYQAALNERVKANTVHITLNFDRADHLETDTLKTIARDYMDQIGFGGQPYLVYRHLDSGHPHLHLVTTNIQRTGKRISLHNLGRNESQKAIQILERRFHLTASQIKKQRQQQTQQAAQKAQYGQQSTKEAIASILNTVVPNYKYTSLQELNAVLKLYNVMADAGSETSRLREMKGLYYRMLDEKGNRIGSPIKASAFEGSPTLSYLEQKFIQNKALKQGHELRLQNAIHWALLRKEQSFSQLINSLEKEGIHTAVSKNKMGVIEGITFVDHKSKCIFMADDLGSAYHTGRLQQRCTETWTQEQQQSQIKRPHLSLKERLEQSLQKENTPAPSLSNKLTTALEQITTQLLSPVKEESSNPYLLKKTQRKRKKQSLHL